MKMPLVIFGSGDIAQLAHLYFSSDSDYEVVAFTLDAQFISTSEFCNLPLIPFDQIIKYFPPNAAEIFIAIGYSKVNQVRKEKYLAAKSMGYRFASYVSSKATVLNQGQIGENCLILEACIIQPFVTIGNNVTLWSGSNVSHHSVIGDHCFIAPNVAISGGVEVKESCFIGISATLRDHITIGEHCVIGAGTLILSNTKDGTVYFGRPTECSDVQSSVLSGI